MNYTCLIVSFCMHGLQGATVKILFPAIRAPPLSICCRRFCNGRR